MKSLLALWREVAEELATWCHTSVALDYKKLESRVKKEGVSFITISLPNFGKDFERSLELGFVDSTAFPGFARRGGLPLFLGGFLELIFDQSSGCAVKDHPDVDAIFAVRQLCYLYSKILLPCSDARVRGAMKGYLDCEKELKEKYCAIPPEDVLSFRRISSLLFGGVLCRMDYLIHRDELIPKHGPGSTAERLLGNAKFDQSEWPERLDSVFPFGEYAIPNWRYYYQLDHVKFLEPDAERPVRVISVPKTLKTPRIIAIEPTCMQYMQQALLNPLVELLESEVVDGFATENLAYSFLGFTDQHPNRELASRASLDRSLATLDLSEASDRVLNKLVIDLLHRNPLFSEAVQATRSTRACVPLRNGSVTVNLEKFASMGSALCFPMEAMVFLTLTFLAIEKELAEPLTPKIVKSLRGKIRVYGDDIIVPTEYVSSVIDCLHAFGAKVNVNKSFWNGNFRESCGGDYYASHDVTPVRCRNKFPRNRHDVSEVISLVELRNHMYKRGLWATARYLDEKIGKVLPYYPVVLDTSPVLGRLSFLGYAEERWDERLHRSLVKGYVVVSRPPPSRVSGEGALLKCLSKQGAEPFVDPRHLERQGRPLAVDIKLRWMPPF